MTQDAANSVRVTGPSGTVGGPFTVTATGTSIVSVAFYVDGRRRGTVRARPGRTKFKWRIDPRRQSPRVHRIRVRVRFADGRTTSRRFIYRPRVLAPVQPRFTG